MHFSLRNLLIVLALCASPGYSQSKSVLGTVKTFKTDTAEIEVQPDKGDAAALKLSAETIVQRVAPGEKDLKNATAIAVTDIQVGDRVLVSVLPDGTTARRLIVMASSDIAKRNEAEHQDWIKRGIAGVVASKTGNQITLKTRSMGGETLSFVTVSDVTKYRRYSPDSVKFAEAKVSSLQEVSVGDQLRAKGEKSADGSKVQAEEIVFGTFITKGGTISAVNADAKTITIQDLTTKKPLTIHLTADSQLKAMPSAPVIGGGPGGPGGSDRPAGGPGGGAGGPGAGGMRGAGGGGGMRGPGGPGGGRGDIAQMLERMPAGKLEDLKPGQTIVVSSTKGAKDSDITAIMIVANADSLIRMAQPQPRAAGRPDAGPSLGGMGLGGGGMGGLDLPGMIP